MMLFSPRVITAFAVLTCFFLLCSVLSVSFNDPTSLFFNPRTGYRPRYSAIRKEEARSFMSTFNTAAPAPKAGDGKKKLCVGIPSTAPEDQDHLRDTIGSLMGGLRPEERAQIYFIVFIPHSEPAKHPAYNQDWLSALTDSVLVYDLPEEEMNHVKEMEKDAGLFREKGIFDYSYLIRKCAEKETPYIAIFEDDIVAMDGWFHRTLRGILEAEEKSVVQRDTPDFLYLRLFYTEEFFGWNSEEAGSYLFYSLWVFGILTTILVYLRNTNVIAQRVLTPRAMYIAFGLIITCISLFFALGRATVLPLPNGVNPMPSYGCCSQAFVFPRQKALDLADYFGERKVGLVDSLTEDFANEKDEMRWAVTPSLVQHIGGKSSTFDKDAPESRFGRNVAERIWSFSFEKHDPELLKLEHEAVAQKMKANGGNPRGKP